MLSGISHDLRTPLTRLKLQLSFIKDKELSKKMSQDVDEMEVDDDAEKGPPQAEQMEVDDNAEKGPPQAETKRKSLKKPISSASDKGSKKKDESSLRKTSESIVVSSQCSALCARDTVDTFSFSLIVRLLCTIRFHFPVLFRPDASDDMMVVVAAAVMILFSPL